MGTYEDLESSLESYRKEHPWGSRYGYLKGKMKRLWQRMTGRGNWPRTNLKARRQRAKRGFADSDLWSLDMYLAKVMSESLRQLADINHGWPPMTMDGREWTFEEWNDHLRYLASLLDEWRTVDDYFEEENFDVDEYQRRAERGNEALMEFFKDVAPIWGHLWD